jgi:3-oxoacyl-[acyl-carrier-protein] synthase-3
VRAQPNPRVQVTGTGACLAERVIDNRTLERLVHGYDAEHSGPFPQWVDQVTHIHERRYVEPGARSSDLGLVAAKQALETAGIEGKDLSLIVYASFTSSHLIPGDHCLLAQALGATSCPTFNLVAACAGSLYGLGLAYGMVASGAMRHVLVVGAETISPVLNFHDPLTAIIFGDGAGAAVVSRDDSAPEGTGMLPPHLSFEYSPSTIRVENSNNPHDLRCFPPLPDKPGVRLVEQALIEMAGGPRVLRGAVNHMAECTARVLGYDDRAIRDGDPGLAQTLKSARLVPHQANGRIVDGLVDKLGVPPERTVRTIYLYGNLSAASNLVALDYGIRHGNMERTLDADGNVVDVHTVPERIQPGDLVLLPSIGGGYLMGCIGFRHRG